MVAEQAMSRVLYQKIASTRQLSHWNPSDLDAIALGHGLHRKLVIFTADMSTGSAAVQISIKILAGASPPGSGKALAILDGCPDSYQLTVLDWNRPTNSES
jgi:hypothetical protein